MLLAENSSVKSCPILEHLVLRVEMYRRSTFRPKMPLFSVILPVS